jgi:phosphopantothenoylcysteine decarboxylase / phosphopantothenate---cysteine ligase
VDSAKIMHEAVMCHLQEEMIFIATAAVADYCVDAPAREKIKKQSHPSLTLTLQLNPDILAEVAASGKASFVVGFAAETTEVVNYAKNKLAAKKADMIIANQVGGGLGFEADSNQVIILTKDAQIELPLTHKTRLAGQIIAILAANIHNSAH